MCIWIDQETYQNVKYGNTRLFYHVRIGSIKLYWVIINRDAKIADHNSRKLLKVPTGHGEIETPSLTLCPAGTVIARACSSGSGSAQRPRGLWEADAAATGCERGPDKLAWRTPDDGIISPSISPALRDQRIARWCQANGPVAPLHPIRLRAGKSAEADQFQQRAGSCTRSPAGS